MMWANGNFCFFGSNAVDIVCARKPRGKQSNFVDLLEIWLKHLRKTKKHNYYFFNVSPKFTFRSDCGYTCRDAIQI